MPQTGAKANRGGAARAVIGFGNALLVTGEQRYIDVWRRMLATINANAKDMGFQQIIRAGESRIYIPSAADKRLDKLIEIADRIGYEGDDSLKH